MSTAATQLARLPREAVRERVARARWERPAVAALLVATGLLYLVGLSASGWGNAFYAAAVQASTKSWQAFFFGSFDSSNFITVDKPPASLWVMDLSARAFGVNSWTLLAPQALEGVAAVALLYATVRRRFGSAAGLVAGAVLALTPVATLMFRFDNPDALLTLLLVGAAYALTRALEAGSTRWLLLVGALVGFAFLAKMLQALTVVPGFGLVYLLAAPGPLRRRLWQLAAGGAALVVSCGWWVAAVALWPASSRPYIGGSPNNSILDLIFGYNGFGRITGNETGSVVGGGGPGGPGAWGPTGITRLFGDEMGTQISWLLPGVLILAAAMLWAWRRAPRPDGRRAAVLLWGSWLVVTGLVFSYAKGIIHPYYTVALAPAIGALAGIGGVWAWRRRGTWFARAAGALALAVTGIWSYTLLERTPDWKPWLRAVVLAASLVAAAAFLAWPLLARRGRLVVAALAVMAVVAALAAPTAYALETASTPHTGAIPAAGPAGASRTGGFGRIRFGFGRGPGAPPAGAPPRFAGPPGFGGRGGGGGRLGGLLDATAPSAALVQLLRTDAVDYRWAAAAVGANSAAGVQLAADVPVMAIGGFNGTDPTPTLAQFKADVAAGKIHYFLGSGGGGGGGGGFRGLGGFGGGGGAAGEIASWVAATFPSQTVGGVTVYDLTAGDA